MVDKRKFECNHSFTVFPQDLNFSGSLFGGKVLAEMDIAAAKLTRRLLYKRDCDSYLTVSANCEFHKSAKLGDIIKMKAVLKTIGRSSMGISLTVEREDLDGLIENIASGNFVFVSVKDGKSTPHGISFGDEIIID